MLKKGHEFRSKKKRQNVKRKQRRKEAEIDRQAVKGQKQTQTGKTQIGRVKTPNVNKTKAPKKDDMRIDLSDENLKEVMERYRKD